VRQANKGNVCLLIRLTHAHREPGARERPVPLHGGRRQLERLSGLLDAHAREHAHRHHLSQTWLVKLETVKGVVECHEVEVGFG